MENNINLKEVIEEAFTQYSGAVIQSRALVDVRDCVKPSARQIYYSLFTDKFVHNKPFKKTLKAIGSAMRFYIHGDSSCEGIIMRSGQPFAMRYPLIEVEGSYGNLMDSGNWAASRYTASRLSGIADYLLKNTDKHTIEEWIDNYDDTEQYPRVLSSLGFYNIINGSTGIAVGLASSIPQFNLNEVNDALIKLLKNPQIDYNEIHCFPDFATGGTIINKDEIYDSIKNGTGKSCIIRAKIEYDKKDNCLIVKELPYGVYTNTICGEITKLVEKNEEIGIININDLTGKDVNIKIYLADETDPDYITGILYNETSLQKSYSINMTMLEDGRFPKIFGWKEALLAHLEHEKKVYINLYNYNLEQLKKKLNIINGLLIAINNIDEVVQIIRHSDTPKEDLNIKFNLNDEQIKAIMDMKLSKLAKLEEDKYIQEKQKLENEIAQIEAILNSEDLLKAEMIKKFEEVKNKYGDERRTQVVQKNIVKRAGTTKTAKEHITEKVVVTITNNGYIKSVPLNQHKAIKGAIMSAKTDTDDTIIIFSNMGKMYRLPVKTIKKCGALDKGTALGSILELNRNEKIVEATPDKYSIICDYVMFITKNGKVKKTKISEFSGSTKNLKGLDFMKLKSDEIIDIKYGQEQDYVNIQTKNKFQITFSAQEVTLQGKVSGGLKGITLSDDEVASFTLGKPAQTPQGRGGKGKRIC